SVREAQGDLRIRARARHGGVHDGGHRAQARDLGGVDRRALLRERRGPGGGVGVIRACLERSVEYARERETFGEPIGKYQFVQDMISEMVLGYETSKLLVMQAAWMKDQGLRNTRETSLAKWHATESAFRAAHLAIQVHGAYGYSAEYGIERYFRNARAPI